MTRRASPGCSTCRCVLPPVMPVNSLAASRAFWWLEGQDADMAKGFAQATYHAHWGEGRDISTPEQVAAIGESLGLPGADLIAATQDPAIKARLKAETDRSLERGVFGSPFFFVDGEPFWGADRLDQVERWLATGGWCDDACSACMVSRHQCRLSIWPS